MSRWYEYHIKKAAELERLANRDEAARHLEKAVKYTIDEDELIHLHDWRHRLIQEESDEA